MDAETWQSALDALDALDPLEALDALKALKDRYDPDQPPLGQLHENDWVWLLNYKKDEHFELKAKLDPQAMAWTVPFAHEANRATERERIFQYVKTMYDQGKPPSEWTGFIPAAAAKYVVLHKRCSEAQRAYLQAVADGEITISFPDPADEPDSMLFRFV